MTRTLRLGAASVNQTPVDWSGNRARLVAAIDEARLAGVGLLCLPELAVSGYGCEDLFYAPHVRRRSMEELLRLLPATEGIAVAVGLAVEHQGRLFNAAAMIADGVLLGFYCKQFLADDGLHYERRWFKPWPSGKLGAVTVDGREVPIGDLTFDLGPLRIGMEVCRDAWVNDRPACLMAGRGVQVVLNPSASHFALSKQEIRKRLALEGAAMIGGAYAFANLLGCESGRTIFDGGTLIAAVDAKGAAQLLAEGHRFSYADHTLAWADVPIEPKPRSDEPPGVVASTFDPISSVRGVEGANAGLPSGAKWVYGQPIEAGTPGPLLDEPAVPPSLSAEREAWESSPHLRHEELARAVALGLCDYARKSGSKGFVLSLSGGADSAACAALVWLLAKLAGDRLPQRLPALGGAVTTQEAVGRLLTTVYQATRNSSDVTRNAARAVAEAVGAEHHEWSVDAFVEGVTRTVGGALGRELSWSTDDVALQNVQARVRAPGVWMLANIKQSLLLATGNRSEGSVGYCTMDGDTAGGLAPIAGIDKHTLREWLRWLETAGPDGVGPLPALAAVNAQQPTAELRPLATHQTDEADLMPYEVLDVIERSLVVRLEDHATALRAITAAFPQHPPEQLAEWLARFERLWRASQWKRERLAPSFHLDTHSTDPRGYRRWPILSAAPWS